MEEINEGRENHDKMPLDKTKSEKDKKSHN